MEWIGIHAAELTRPYSADMLTLQAAYPWQMPEFVAAEDADILAFHDAAREAWLDDWLADLFEEPSEPAEPLTNEPAEPEEPCDKCGGTGEEWLSVSGGDGWTGKPCPYCSYVPFQLDASEYSDCVGTLGSEIGYAESVTPYLF